MAATYTLPGVLLSGDHASRPAASAVAAGTLYAETDTGQAYQSDGASTWTAWGPSYAGSGMANPMSAVGDMIQGTTGGAPAALAAGAAGTVPTSAGAATPLAYAYPPGYELDYAQVTSTVNVTGTATGSATTLVTGNAVTYSGSERVCIEFYCAWVKDDFASLASMVVELRDGTTVVNWLAERVSATRVDESMLARIFLTPTAGAHTYKATAYGGSGSNVAFGAAAVGAGADYSPMYLRITKA